MRHATCGLFLLISLLTLASSQILVARDEKPAEVKPVRLPDLSKFPALQGKVDSVLGNFHTFVGPKGGETFKLDLKEVPKLRGLCFNEQLRNNVAVVAIPTVSLPGQLFVESVEYDKDGSLLCLTLLAKGGRGSMTLEIGPAPEHGEKTVEVWVTARSDHRVIAVARIECERDGEFPGRP
jgi:hypothetical protein